MGLFLDPTLRMMYWEPWRTYAASWCGLHNGPGGRLAVLLLKDVMLVSFLPVPRDTWRTDERWRSSE